MHKDHFFKISCVLTLLTALFLVRLQSVKAETYYKYVAENGTVVITQNWDDVPKDQREKAEEVHFEARPDVTDEAQPSAKTEAAGKDNARALKEIVNEEKIKAVGEETLYRGKTLLRSFFNDQKTLLIAYGLSGITAFFLFSKLLKRFAGGFVAKIVMKISIIVVIFSGVYLLYLSWLNKTVLNFNQSEDFSGQNLADQITTPGEILQQTQDVVDQFNENATQREAILNGMDGS